jgi:hypothetical protein
MGERMSDFKVGDMVECTGVVRPGTAGSYLWLNIGNEYEVAEVNHIGNIQIVDKNGSISDARYEASLFKKVLDKQPEPEGAGFKVGDMAVIDETPVPNLLTVGKWYKIEDIKNGAPRVMDNLGSMIRLRASRYRIEAKPAPEPTTVKSCLSPEQLRAELQEADKDPGTTIDWDKMNAILDEAEEGATFSYRSVARAAHKLAEDYATRTLLNDSKINWSIDYGNGKSHRFHGPDYKWVMDDGMEDPPPPKVEYEYWLHARIEWPDGRVFDGEYPPSGAGWVNHSTKVFDGQRKHAVSSVNSIVKGVASGMSGSESHLAMLEPGWVKCMAVIYRRPIQPKPSYELSPGVEFLGAP